MELKSTGQRIRRSLRKKMHRHSPSHDKELLFKCYNVWIMTAVFVSSVCQTEITTFTLLLWSKIEGLLTNSLEHPICFCFSFVSRVQCFDLNLLLRHNIFYVKVKSHTPNNFLHYRLNTRRVRFHLILKIMGVTDNS